MQYVYDFIKTIEAKIGDGAKVYISNVSYQDVVGLVFEIWWPGAIKYRISVSEFDMRESYYLDWMCKYMKSKYQEYVKTHTTGSMNNE